MALRKALSVQDVLKLLDFSIAAENRVSILAAYNPN